MTNNVAQHFILRTIADIKDHTEHRRLLILYLQEQIGRVFQLKSSTVDPKHPLTRYGLDSLSALEIAHEIQQSLGIDIPVATLFQANTLEQLADILSEVLTSTAKGNQASSQLKNDMPPLDAVAHSNETQRYRLSDGQRAIWFLQHLVPENTAYNIARAFRIRTALNREAFKRAFHKVVKRHASLHTTIVTIDGEPFQQIDSNFTLFFHEEDVSKWDDNFLNAYLQKEANRPFLLEEGSLVRIYLLTRSADEHILLLVLHHIIADFWSLSILQDELKDLYEAEKTGQACTLPPVPYQYADYVHWQQQMLESSREEQLRIYWKEQLGGELSVINLPTDRPRLRNQLHYGAMLSFALNAEQLKGLQHLSKANATTLYMTLLAVFKILLYRYTGQEDIVVGTPAADRKRAELADLVGYLINPIVLRSTVTGTMTYVELLQQVRQTVLDGFQHQEYPFLRLAQELQPQRALNRSPLFQVLFSLQNLHHDARGELASVALGSAGKTIHMCELSLEVIPLVKQYTQFDLVFFFAEEAGQLLGSVEYSTELFDDTTIQRMIQHFQNLVQGIIAFPEQPIADLPLMSSAECQQLLHTQNQTAKPFSKRLCIHQLIEEQAAQTPNAPALVFQKKIMTYQELNHRSNQLARFLRERGAGPDTPIGICVDRSFEMVIGLLSILKSGAAYVPLEPTYPPERLTTMVKHAQLSIILTQQRHEHLLSNKQINIICLDADWERIAQKSQANLENLASLTNLAYIIFTSGSTGRPKGVMLQHEGICNRLLWMQDMYKLTTDDCVVQKTPFSFDVSVWEFFWPLMVGARLVIAKPEGHKTSTYLSELIQEEKVTTIHFVPSMLSEFLQVINRDSCQSLRRVICSGEALTLTLQEQFFARSRAELHNLYGPTEASIDVTYFPCERQSRRYSLPIGRPIANIRIYILDAHLQPVPVGVTGEIYIGGIGVARGYVGQPELTAATFIPDSFSATPGGRLYRTGDLGRFLQDGNIDYLGRVDYQIKIRGFRIEIGEIEAVLTRHPNIEEAVVVTREVTQGHKILVAYIVLRGQAMLDSSQLRIFLSSKLPEYMVPARFVPLEKLPLSQNGKVMRSALPSPTNESQRDATSFSMPTSLVEKQLVKIWEELLNVHPIGIHDNFFELGGDSILSMQMVAKANRLGIHLTQEQPFQYQTIADLTNGLDLNQQIRVEAQEDISGTAPLTPVQQWFFSQGLKRPSQFNQTLWLEMNQPLELEFLQDAIASLFHHHDSLRLRFKDEGEGWYQYYEPFVEHVMLTWLDLSCLSTDEQDQVMVEVTERLQSSFDLSTGPLMASVLFDFSTKRPQQLVWCIHHLIVDGVSWRILLEDFQTFYRQIGGKPSEQLLPKTASYKRWADQLVRYQQHAQLEREKPYWFDVKRKNVPLLPTDYLEGEAQNTVASIGIISTVLDPSTTRSLLQELPKYSHIQIDDFLVTGMILALQKWTKKTQFLVDIEQNGRHPPFPTIDLSRTVGWFTTIFPLWLELPLDLSFVDALASVTNQRRSVPNNGFGYGILRYLNSINASSQPQQMMPDAQVSFNYLGQLDQIHRNSELFQITKIADSIAQSPLENRHYWLEMNSYIWQNCLHFTWIFSKNLHQWRTIVHLAESCKELIKLGLEAYLSSGSTRHSATAFPQARLNQTELDSFVQYLQNQS